MIQIVSYRGGMIFAPNIPRVVESIEKLFTHYPTIIDAIPQDSRYNHFFTLAHHKGAATATTEPIRSAMSFDYQEVMAFDIDGGVSDREYDYRAVVAEYFGMPKEAFGLANSGNGVHLYVRLTTPITQAAYFKENKKFYRAICEAVTLKLNENGLPGKLDPAIFDPARVLRLWGSTNHKPNKEPKECRLLEMPVGHYEMNLATLSGLERLEAENLSPEFVKRNYPTPDLGEIVTQCVFMKEVIDAPQTIKEPVAFDFFSIMAAQSPDTRFEHLGVSRSAVELSNWVFDNAVNSTSLRRSDFGVRWEGAAKYGPRRCSTINDNHAICHRCPHFGKIDSPISLKSKEHIGSAGTGYWVLNKKGERLRPHYEDLMKVFKKRFHLKMTEDGRIYTIDEGLPYYTMHEPTWIKSLMEKIVYPTEMLMDYQRMEFVNKLKSNLIISKQQEKEFFVDSIKGKLNFKNGVLDILTGEFAPYTPDLGFRHVLPYDYNPKQDSPYFMEWLSYILCNEKQLIDTTLDVLAYCLWPAYDDHLFVMLQGGGGNGKSTLLHVMGALLGEENVAHVSLQQLVTNRFSKSLLDGKMVNLSEEGSGVKLGDAEVNTIKDLSCGGTTSAEPKGKQGYNMHKTAKLMFAVNKSPDFKTVDEALKRRLVVIPFNRAITDLDPNVEARLLEEIPGIANMLAQRLRDNVKANKGVFKVSRGNGMLHAAQQRMLSAYKNVADWAEENVVHTAQEHDFISVADAYLYYTQWCEQAKEDPLPRNKFTLDMKEFVLPDKRNHKQKRIDGKVFWGFEGLKFSREVNDIQ